MCILLVFSSSRLGGAERSLTRMALASPVRDYQLSTLDIDGPWCDWVRNLGRQPLVFGRRNSEQHGPIGVGALWKLLRYVRRERIRVVYVCGLRAALWLRLLKPFMPGVRLVHGIRWNPDTDSRLDLLFRAVEWLLNGLVDLYIANSKISAKTLADRCGISADKIRVIYNGVTELPSNATPLKDRPLNVLTVANLNPRKGHREYLQVITAVVHAIPSARFIFVGRDDMGGEIQKAIDDAGLSEIIRCEGFQKDVSSYFLNARVCVLPSLWGEGCPTSLLESMAWGVPVIGYRVDGVPELIKDGIDGYVVEIGNVTALADRIIELLSDTKKAETFGYSGTVKVASDFTLKACSSFHKQAFEDLLKIK